MNEKEGRLYCDGDTDTLKCPKCCIVMMVLKRELIYNLLAEMQLKVHFNVRLL